MPFNLLQTLSDLVALPSVNPMGREVSGREFYEHQVTEYLEQFFKRLGVPYLRQPIAPLRDNIIARLDGEVAVESGGALVMLDAHQDTVPVTDMTIDPWKPVVRDGRLYGRGACDIKGGMAAMLAAFARLAEERPRGMPTVLMVCTANEEFGFTGAKALPMLWEQGSSIIPRRPDLAIIAEPTELNVVVAHKGVARWRCHALGRAAHSSQPQMGDSAIYRMARVLEALEIYQHDIVGKLAEHPRCGRPTLSVGTIGGGLSVNTVPAHCTIEIDRRCVPGEVPREAYRHVLDYLRDCLGADPLVQHDEPFSESHVLNDTVNGPLAMRLHAIAKDVTDDCEIIGVAFGTNAPAIADAGIPTVVFGPGSIAQAHTADEWIAIDQLEKAAEIYYRFAKSSRSGNGA
jgi:acetylornithine deacetylase/succinyl-diaminopimelate desuccinylase-like protein